MSTSLNYGKLPYLACLLLLLLFLAVPCPAQFLPHTNYKYQVALSVSQRIGSAKGDMRKMPVLEINSTQSSQQIIAQFKPFPQPKIIIDEQLYDICIAFGADSLNALACIIGHELAHFYENHSWGNSFADMTGIVQDNATPISKTERSLLEAEADYFGLFYGFLAGYETFRLLPEVLKAIYQNYQLPEQLEGYPKQQERLLIAAEKARQLIPLAYAFKAGQMLYLAKNYAEADVCFEFVLSGYPGREIYNNSGITKLAQAMELMEPEEASFAFPFELDAQSRLKRGRLRTGEDKMLRQQKINHLLSQAQSSFEKAIAIDRTYISGYVNLACTYSLQGNQAAAIGRIYELEKNLKDINEILPGNAHLIRAIAMVKNDQINKAGTDFDLAFEKKAYQAEYNRALYKKINAGWQDQISEWLRQWPALEAWIHNFWNQATDRPDLQPEKTREWFTLVNATETTNNSESVILNISDINFPVKISATETDNFLQFNLELSDYILLIYFTSSPYAGATSMGITIGDHWNTVIKKYGEPSYTAAGPGTVQYAYYERSRLIFELENNSVKGWWIYTTVY